MNSKFKNLFIAILTALVLVGIAFTSHAQYSVNVSSHGGKSTYKINNVVGDYKVEYEGDFQLSDDDKDIVAISRGGYFEISKSSFGASRKVRIESEGGQMKRRYYVGWSENDFEPEGRKWLAEVLPDLVRSTTIGAEYRVDRIYRKQGAAGLAKEVSLLQGDHVTSTYLSLIFKKELSDSDLAKLLTAAGNTISSDHYLSNVLTNFQKKYSLNAITTGPFIEAATKVGSDHYQANILISVAENSNVGDEYLEQAIKATRGINSDHYRSNALKVFVNHKKLNTKQIAAVLESADGINSGHYLSNMLIELLDEQELNSENVSQFVRVAEGIDSDVYSVNTYQALLQKQTLTNNDLEQILGAVDEIGSDTYLSNLLREMLEEKRDTPILKKLFEAAADNIGSDHYLAEVLKTAVRKQKIEGQAMDAFASAIQSISSGNYVHSVIQESRNVAWGNESLIKLINACGQIGSDHYLAQSLTTLAPQVNQSDDAVKSAYRNTAKRISSETYYGRAMKALDY
ncbi:MAG: hypothetical protein RIC35_03825 [Marinoscillum sp.]